MRVQIVFENGEEYSLKNVAHYHGRSVASWAKRILARAAALNIGEPDQMMAVSQYDVAKEEWRAREIRLLTSLGEDPDTAPDATDTHLAGDVGAGAPGTSRLNRLRLDLERREGELGTALREAEDWRRRAGAMGGMMPLPQVLTDKIERRTRVVAEARARYEAEGGVPEK